MTNRAAQIAQEMAAFDELPEVIRRLIADNEIAINPIPVLADLREYGETVILECFRTGDEPWEVKARNGYE